MQPLNTINMKRKSLNYKVNFVCQNGKLSQVLIDDLDKYVIDKESFEQYINNGFCAFHISRIIGIISRLLNTFNVLSHSIHSLKTFMNVIFN